MKRWPSGLRRQIKALVRKSGVKSHSRQKIVFTHYNFIFYLLDVICVAAYMREELEPQVTLGDCSSV
jgi:hypothetical protein